MLKHKTSAVILLSLLMMLSVSCRQEISEKPELDVSAPDIETEIVETVGDWQTDPTGTFSYLKVNPHLQFDMFFEEGMVFHDNMFIYEVYDSSAEPVKMYGYMDTDFNKMTEPISLEPNVFMYGLTRIVTDDSSYILSKDLQSVNEHYPGCVFVDDTLMKVDWGKEIYSDPFMVTGIDLETYLVPCKVEPGAGNELASPVYGYKTVQDAYINGTPAEENFVIPAVYQDVRLFCDGMAAVKANDKWGFIDMEGNVIVECKYVDAISLTHGVAAVYDEVGYNDLSFGSWVLIDTSGNELIPGTSFSGTDKFQPNKFIDNLTFIGGGNYKLLNSDGEILTDWLTYEDDGPPLFHEDYIVLNNTGGKYFYDKTGHLAFPTRFSDARDFSDGLAAVYNNKTQKMGIYKHKLGKSHTICLFQDNGFQPGICICKY